MIGNLFRGFVEGLGSKTLANVFAAIFSVVLVTVLNKVGAKYGIGLSDGEFYTVIGSILSLAFGFLFKQWHLDIKTDGKTTTQALLIDKLAKMAASTFPEKTVAHRMADAVDAAIPDEGMVASAMSGPQTPPVQK